MEKYGFVYIWRDKKHNRYYIGCHWGTTNDGYICSSNWMRDAYKRRPEDFKRRIIAKVSNKKEMYQEEGRWLQMIEEGELRTRYYNLHKNHANHFWGDEKKAKSAVEKMAASLRKRNAAMTPEERSEKFGNRRGSVSPRKGMTLEQEYGPEKAAEIREQIKAARANQVITEESNEKRRKHKPWNKGKIGVYSKETKQKMGASWKGKKRGDKLSDEGRKSISKKNSNRMKELWQDPEYRKMIMEARKC